MTALHDTIAQSHPKLPAVALSIRQPWAWLIVSGHKDVENRDWSTRYRGPVLIHAAKAWGPDERETNQDLLDGYNPCDQSRLPGPLAVPETHQLGGIIGVAEIYDCVSASASPWFCGRFGFLLRNARPLPFMPVRGQLSFFACTYEEPTP